MSLKKIATVLSLIIIFVFLMGCGGPEERKQKFFDKGKTLYENKKYVKASLELKNALQIDPKYAEANYMLGMVYFKQRNWKNAFAFLSKAVELDPDILDAQVILGQLLLMARDKKGSMQKIELVLSKDAEHVEALLLKATFFLVAREDEKAESILEKMLSDHPERTESYMMLARIRLNRKENNGAIQLLKDLLLREENVTARLFLADILEKEEDHEGAEQEYQTLAKNHPEVDAYKLLLAGFYERIQKPEKAENILKELIASNPDEEKYRLSLAQYYVKTGRTDDMVTVLEQAAKDLPGEYGAFETLARHYMNEKSPEKAIAMLDRFMSGEASRPKFIMAKVYKAYILFTQKKYDQALDLVDETLQEDSGDVRARALRGDILVLKNNFIDAISEYRTVLGDEPGNDRVALKLARVHFYNGESGLAEETYHKALDRNPKLRQARFDLAGIYRQKGKLDRAREQIDKLLEDRPDDRKALLIRGDVALLQKDIETARDSFTRLFKLIPESPLAQFKMGLIFFIEKKVEQAASLFEKALSTNPGFEPALNQLVQVMVRKNDLSGAIKRVEDQLVKIPENAKYHQLLGSLQAVDKKFDLARKSFEKSLQINPDNFQVMLNLVRIEITEGSLDTAITRTKALREKSPDNLGIAIFLAALYEQTERYKMAKVIYEEILKTNPENKPTANNLAFYYAQHEPSEENLEKAKSLVGPLLEEFIEVPEIVDTWAWIRYRQGDYNEAKDLLMRVEAKAKDIAVLNYHLGMVFHRLGEKSNAVKYLELALKGDDVFPGRNEAESTLNDLKRDL